MPRGLRYTGGSEDYVFPRLLHGTTRRLALGLVASSLLISGSYIVSEANVLLQTAPTLGAASSFAVLGGSTVTNTGSSTVSGDLGVSSGSAVTGFPPGTVVGGSIHAADALAGRAQADSTTAYNALAGQPCTADLSGLDLGGRTLTAGVYCFSSSAGLTGTLTLDALGNPVATFVFKTVSTLTTASGSTVRLINGGSPCNVFWQVGSSATLGTSTTFLGNILALANIRLLTGASVAGRALARVEAVNMDTNTISGCAVGVATATPTPTSTVPPTGTATAPPTATAIPTVTRTPTAVITASPTGVTGGTGGSSPPPATQTAVSAATATAVTAATATAIATLPAATQTAVIAATSTAVTAATATAIATLPAATQTAEIAAETQTAEVAGARQTAAAVATAAAVSGGGETALTPPAEIPAVETPATPGRVPSSLPNTGGGSLPPGPLALFLLGGLAVAVGLTLRLARK